MSQQIPVKDISPDPVKVYEPQYVDLYAKREKIHARAISGFFQNIRVATLYLTMAVFFLLPWLNWDGRQAILFDLPERHFYIFWWTFLPRDFFFLSWILIIAAFALFAATVFAGRVWCGYACPQTVWTKVFMWIEELAEGNRNARMRLDNAPMSVRKFLRRSFKHAGWAVVAFATGIAFIGYFTPVRELWFNVVNGNLGFWVGFWLLFFTIATYLNAGWMREQVCLHMCPYGRFQSVMFDKDTLIISYDYHRGDPRGSRKRGTTSLENGLGDCIDCNMCVQVCPTGIDIRDGLQFECIQCAACIDACDSVMDQMGYERGLVRYTTENLLEKTGTGTYTFFRPRLIGYSAALLLMVGALLFTLITRVPLTVEALRDRGQLYNQNNAGWIENSYTLKIQNKAQDTVELVITASSVDFPISLQNSPIQLRMNAGELATLPITIEADPAVIPSNNNKIEIHVTRQDDSRIQATTRNTFLAPR